MKGQVGLLIFLLFLVTGIIALILVYLLILPLQAIVPPSLEPQVVGVITALLGFLPEQCSSLTNIDCKYCLATNKVLPLALNIALSFIIFSIVFILLRAPIGEFKEEGEGWGIEKGQIGAYSAILLISIAFGLFMIHQKDPFLFIGIHTFFIAIVLRIMASLLQFQEAAYGHGLLRLTDFLLGAYILVNGIADNLWWMTFLIVFWVTLIVATATIQRPEGIRPRVHMTRLNILALLVFVVIIWGILMILITTLIPDVPEFLRPLYEGVPKYIGEKLKVGDIKCENTIGPESSISI